MFPDDALRSENVLEKIILNTTISLIEFQSALLRNSALELRSACGLGRDPRPLEGGEFLELRRSVLELLK
jgi:hypothetical protein